MQPSQFLGNLLSTSFSKVMKRLFHDDGRQKTELETHATQTVLVHEWLSSEGCTIHKSIPGCSCLTTLILGQALCRHYWRRHWYTAEACYEWQSPSTLHSNKTTWFLSIAMTFMVMRGEWLTPLWGHVTAWGDMAFHQKLVNLQNFKSSNQREDSHTRTTARFRALAQWSTSQREDSHNGERVGYLALE